MPRKCKYPRRCKYGVKDELNEGHHYLDGTGTERGCCKTCSAALQCYYAVCDKWLGCTGMKEHKTTTDQERQHRNPIQGEFEEEAEALAC
jgi:hypothetical protein